MDANSLTVQIEKRIEMKPQTHILLVGYRAEEGWNRILAEAVKTIGKVRSIRENEVDLITHASYDLIIVDASLVSEAAPLIRRIRPLQPRARILVVTASPAWQMAREALKAGANDYISKLYDKRELQAAVKSTLAQPPARFHFPD